MVSSFASKSQNITLFRKDTIFWPTFLNVFVHMSSSGRESSSSDITILRRKVGDCPYIEGYIFEENDRILGYSMVAKSYSTEYGGICVWVEDLYMKEEARGLGIGTAFFSFLDEKYKDQAVRFRLEVEEENERAVAVYKKAGYHPLPYMQMTKEQ